MVQAIRSHAEVEGVVLERYFLRILKAPLERGEFIAAHARIQIGNGDVVESAMEKGLAVAGAAAEHENLHVPPKVSLPKQLFEDVEIEIAHGGLSRNGDELGLGFRKAFDFGRFGDAPVQADAQ